MLICNVWTAKVFQTSLNRNSNTPMPATIVPDVRSTRRSRAPKSGGNTVCRAAKNRSTNPPEARKASDLVSEPIGASGASRRGTKV